MSGESQLSREAREKATVGVPGLGNKHVHTAQENSKVEADLGNNVTEPVEEIKYLETMKVFDESPKTKAEPEEPLSPPVTWPTIQLWLLFTISEDVAQRSTEPASLL